MTQPVRITRRRAKGYNMQEHSKSINGLDCKYVGRPGKYGNNYKVGDKIMYHELGVLHPVIIRTFLHEMVIKNAEGAVYLFERFQLPNMDLSELIGFNLSCWCKADTPGANPVPCHVSSILREIRKRYKSTEQ